MPRGPRTGSHQRPFESVGEAYRTLDRPEEAAQLYMACGQRVSQVRGPLEARGLPGPVCSCDDRRRTPERTREQSREAPTVLEDFPDPRTLRLRLRQAITGRFRSTGEP